MNTPAIRLSDFVREDLQQAHDAYCEIYNAIEALQGTDHWIGLPQGLRRAICGVRFVADRMSDQIEPMI